MSQKFLLEVECGNAAFTDYAHELPRIMRQAAERIEAGVEQGKCYDWNGNVVGQFRIYTGKERNK
jgi:hypothetical protein